VIHCAVFYHLPTCRDGKEGQQRVRDEEKEKKEKYQFNSKTMNLHEILCVSDKFMSFFPSFTGRDYGEYPRPSATFLKSAVILQSGRW